MASLLYASKVFINTKHIVLKVAKKKYIKSSTKMKQNINTSTQSIPPPKTHPKNGKCYVDVVYTESLTSFEIFTSHRFQAL